MEPSSIVLPLKRFLLIPDCPPEWTDLDLYVIRDEAVTFYVGQSHLAFNRVWDHLLSGFKGHSMVGRFIWANWPISMRFTIELHNSRSAEFAPAGNDLNACERMLIERLTPCFNISLNSRPAQIPTCYLPANASLRCSRSLNKLIHQAERVVRAEDTLSLLKEPN